MAALQEELQSWVGANSNLRPHAEGQIGWLARTQAADVAKELDCTVDFRELYGSLPPVNEPLTIEAIETLLPLPTPDANCSWRALRYLIVPGLRPAVVPSVVHVTTRPRRVHGVSDRPVDKVVPDVHGAAVLRLQAARLALRFLGHRH